MFGRFKGWFSALSFIGKAGVILAVVSTSAIVNAVIQPNSTPPPEPPPQVQGEKTEPKVEAKTETTTEEIPYDTKTIDDPNLAAGTNKTQTDGVNGIKSKTWKVTYTNDKETNRILEKEEISTQPVTKIIAHGTKEISPCSPNYSGCVPIASDVDCAGGSGNGPAYVNGPISVIGSDIYDLDRDNDGIACE